MHFIQNSKCHSTRQRYTLFRSINLSETRSAVQQGSYVGCSMCVTLLTYDDSAKCSLRNTLVGIVGKGIKQKLRGTRFGSRVVVSSSHRAGSVTHTARNAINQRRLIRKVSVGSGVRNWSSKCGGKLDLGSRRCRQGMVLDVDHQYGDRSFPTRTSANARTDSMQPGSLFQRHRNSTAFWVLGVLNNSGKAFWIKNALSTYKLQSKSRHGEPGSRRLYCQFSQEIGVLCSSASCIILCNCQI